jgi:wobble nucleotide-excising tRNase
MLRRINYLKNIGKFENLRSGSGAQHEFGKYNVVFARNAIGKSTLCDIFRSLGTNSPGYVTGRKRFGATGDIEIELLFAGTPAPKAKWISAQWEIDPRTHQVPPILVFDERFVADNVFIGGFVDVEHRRNLYGLALGENGKRLKERVDQAEASLNAATATLNEARTAVTRLVPSGLTIEAFRALASVENVDQTIAEAEAELETQKRRQVAINQIKNRPEFPGFTVPEVPTALASVLEASLDSAAIAAENTVRNHLQQRPQPLPLEWAAQGHGAQVGESCPYCAQDMKSSPLLRSYRDFFSGALRGQEENRKSLQREVERLFGSSARDRLRAVLVGHQRELEWWNDAASVRIALPSVMDSDEIVSRMNALDAALTAALNRKRENPSESVTINADEQQAITRWQEAVGFLTELSGALNAANVVVRAQKAAAGTVDLDALTRQVSTLKHQKARAAAAVAPALGAFDQATSSKTQADREKTEANTALREQSQVIFDQYGVQINQILERFGVEFRLGTEPIRFHGGPPACELTIELLGSRVSLTLQDMRNPARPSLANTLSGGDKSAIGLAYFLAVVLNDPQLADSIVFFDDPFHSQDRSRRQRTIEWVQTVAARAAQCFVLSHELDFAHCAARCRDEPGKTFVFDESGQHPILSGSDLPDGPGSTYNDDFEGLRVFAENPRGDQNKLRAIARSIRPTIEYFLRVKYPGQFEENKWLGDMIAKIRDATSGPLVAGKRFVTDLSQVNEFDKRFHHSENPSPASTIDPVEMQGYVNQALDVISS